MSLPNIPHLEAKPYGPESTKAQIEALRARVCFVESNVIYFKEVYFQTIFQIDVMFDELNRLRTDLLEWYLIVDLTQTTQPSAEIRAHIRNKYLNMKNPQLIVLVVGNNYLIRLAARFVAGRSLKTPYLVVSSLDVALQKVRQNMA